MNKIQNKLQKYQVKLLVFALLFLLITACLVRQSKDDSKTRNKPEKSETTEKKDTGSVEKLKTQTKPKDNEKNALSSTTEDLKKAVCRKYDECGSQDYEECMEQAEYLNFDDDVWECMLNSSCESLIAEKPDACLKTENNPTTTVPETNGQGCYETKCTKNSDCPGNCHGGCTIKSWRIKVESVIRRMRV